MMPVPDDPKFFERSYIAVINGTATINGKLWADASFAQCVLGDDGGCKVSFLKAFSVYGHKQDVIFGFRFKHLDSEVAHIEITMTVDGDERLCCVMTCLRPQSTITVNQPVDMVGESPNETMRVDIIFNFKIRIQDGADV